MDKVKVRQLELEIEEINRVQDEGENQDTTDGFKRFVKKQLHKICSKKYEKKTAGASSSLGGAKSSRGEGDADLADVYDFSHPERGLAVIINNEDFSVTDHHANRTGSSYDAMALYQTFKNLGFTVWVKKNLKAWQMEEVLKSARDDYDHANADCFVCAILSHGDETLVQARNDGLGLRVRKDLLYGTDDKVVSTSTIMDLFTDFACENLEGKPRLFFIQACRGEKCDDGVSLSVTKQRAYTSESGRQSFHGTDHGNTQDGARRPHSNTEASSSSYAPKSQTDATDAKPGISQETIEEGRHNVTLNATSSEALNATGAPWAPLRDVYVCPTPLYKDSLIMYATPPGYFAWRRETGAWFVQSLCRVLNSQEIASRSLLSALVHVVGIVAREYQSEAPSKPYMHQKKEVPVIESMLVKDVFFAPK